MIKALKALTLLGKQYRYGDVIENWEAVPDRTKNALLESEFVFEETSEEYDYVAKRRINVAGTTYWPNQKIPLDTWKQVAVQTQKALLATNMVVQHDVDIQRKPRRQRQRRN